MYFSFTQSLPTPKKDHVGGMALEQGYVCSMHLRMCNFFLCSSIPRGIMIQTMSRWRSTPTTPPVTTVIYGDEDEGPTILNGQTEENEGTIYYTALEGEGEEEEVKVCVVNSLCFLV